MTLTEADKLLITALEVKMGRDLTIAEKELVCAFPGGLNGKTKKS